MTARMLRRAQAVVTLAVLSFVLPACQLESTLGSKAAYLEVHVEPETARVVVDDESVGSARVVAANPVKLSPGKHYVTIEAKGYFPHDLELDLPPGLTKVEVQLRPLPQ
jgi:hypothetical protein